MRACGLNHGALTVAINALQSVSSPHRFLGINQEGGVSIVTTKGNAYGHVVLRGGNGCAQRGDALRGVRAGHRVPVARF